MIFVFTLVDSFLYLVIVRHLIAEQLALELDTPDCACRGERRTGPGAVRSGWTGPGYG